MKSRVLIFFLTDASCCAVGINPNGLPMIRPSAVVGCNDTDYCDAAIAWNATLANFDLTKYNKILVNFTGYHMGQCGNGNVCSLIVFIYFEIFSSANFLKL